jgi:hypothetical protein
MGQGKHQGKPVEEVDWASISRPRVEINYSKPLYKADLESKPKDKVY